MSSKKKEQLGMNPSTANHRLLKDILWRMVVDTGQDDCYVCQEKMTREDFSIEHKEPWLDTDDPVERFFDVDNIAFSHLSCNCSNRRQGTPSPECGSRGKYRKGCRCTPCIEASSKYQREAYYTPERRSERYRRTGR